MLNFTLINVNVYEFITIVCFPGLLHHHIFFVSSKIFANHKSYLYLVPWLCYHEQLVKVNRFMKRDSLTVFSHRLTIWQKKLLNMNVKTSLFVHLSLVVYQLYMQCSISVRLCTLCNLMSTRLVWIYLYVKI